MIKLKRELKSIYTIWYRDVLRFSRDRTRMISSLAQPLLFLFIFGGGLAPAMAPMGGGENWTSNSSCSPES